MTPELTPPPAPTPDGIIPQAGDRVGEISQAFTTALGGLHAISITTENADESLKQLEEIRDALALVIRGESVEQTVSTDEDTAPTSPEDKPLSQSPHEVVHVDVAASSEPGKTKSQRVKVAVKAVDRPPVAQTEPSQLTPVVTSTPMNLDDLKLEASTTASWPLTKEYYRTLSTYAQEARKQIVLRKTENESFDKMHFNLMVDLGMERDRLIEDDSREADIVIHYDKYRRLVRDNRVFREILRNSYNRETSTLFAVNLAQKMGNGFFDEIRRMIKDNSVTNDKIQRDLLPNLYRFYRNELGLHPKQDITAEAEDRRWEIARALNINYQPLLAPPSSSRPQQVAEEPEPQSPPQAVPAYELRLDSSRPWQEQVGQLKTAFQGNTVVNTAISVDTAKELMPTVITGALQNKAIQKYVSGLDFNELTLTQRGTEIAIVGVADASFAGAAKLLGKNQLVNIQGNLRVDQSGGLHIDGVSIEIPRLNPVQRTIFGSQREKIIKAIGGADLQASTLRVLRGQGVPVQQAHFTMMPNGIGVRLRSLHTVSK